MENNANQDLDDTSFEDKILDSPTEEKSVYPSLMQGFGLLGILIAVNIIVSIPAAPLMMNSTGMLTSVLIFVTYVATFGLVFAAGLKLRGSNILQWKSFPLISLPILAIATVALIIARIPLMELLPFPEEWLEAFMESMKNMMRVDVITLLTLAVAAPILEELIFRGIILEGFLKRYSPTKAIIWSSVLFGLAHMNPWQFISAFAMGILLGWVYHRTQSLWPCIFIHFVNNFLAFIPAFFIDDYMENSSMDPVETFGSTSNYYLAIGISVLIIGVSLYLLKQIFDKKDKEDYA